MANKPVGCPPKYKKEYDDQVKWLCLLWATDIDIANFFSIDEATVNRWKKKYPTFWESLKEGKEVADIHIVNSLYNRAKGMKLNKQAVIKVKVSKDEEEDRVIDYVEEIAPDPISLKFWLTNRRHNFWRDKKEVDNTISNKDDVPFKVATELKDMSEEELNNYIQARLTWTTPKK